MIDPFPWEVAEERVTIIDEKWRALRNAPDFIRYWRGEAAEDVCVFRLSVAAYIKDFVHAEVRTMLSIWYSKQGKKFDRAAWEKYTQPNALKKAAEARSKRTRLSWKQYRKEVQQI